MPSRRRHARGHGRGSIIAIAVAALLIGGVDVFLLAYGGDATPVSLDHTLEDYRASDPSPEGSPQESPTPTPEGDPGVDDAVEEVDPTPSPASTPTATATATPTTDASPSPTATPAPASSPAAFARPARGVYTYATSGQESINMPGGSRTYPAETYLTVRHDDGCRWEIDHRVSEERRDRRTYCSRAGEVLFVAAETSVTFFGQTDGTSIRCDPPTIVVTTTTEPGTSWSGVCHGEDTEIHETSTYLGRDRVRVGGSDVDAYRVMFEGRISGRAEGTSRAEVWLHPQTGLSLRVVRETDTTTRGFGAGRIRYQEQATFELVSLDPQT